jgi:hypothetical protein
MVMDKQVVINLINTIIRDGRDATWCESDIIEKLMKCGLTEWDLIEYGFGDLVSDYCKKEEE